MVERGFGQAFVAGIIIAAGIGIGTFLLLLLQGILADGDLFFMLFLALGVMVVLVTGGSVITGTMIGAAAGRRSQGLGPAAGAGFAAGLVGQLFIIFCVFAGFSTFDVLAEEEADDDPFGEDDPESTVPWSEFGEALIFLVPGSIGGLFGAMATAPWTRRDMEGEAAMAAAAYGSREGAFDDDAHEAAHDPYGEQAYEDEQAYSDKPAYGEQPYTEAEAAEAPPPEPEEEMRRLRCPSCSHRFAWPRRTRPVCPACGHSG